MAEPGHPHEVRVLHNRHPAAGTHEASAKKTKKGKECRSLDGPKF